MKVFRITRHAPTEAQVRDLRVAFGDDAEIVTVSEIVQNAARVSELAREHGAGAVEVVLPLAILAEVVGRGIWVRGTHIPVIRAPMNRALTETGDAVFSFDHYEVVEKVEVVTPPLLPAER